MEEPKITEQDYSNYQVVRQEYVTGFDDIYITFNKGRLYINSYGLSQFPDKDYIQVLVDDSTKCMIIKPVKNKVRDSFRWCGGKKKRKPRHINCVPLFYLVFQMMKWDINARYRVRGNIDDSGEDKVIFIDLNDAICYVRMEDAVEIDENGKTRIKPQYQLHMPKEWEKCFGMPVMDYENRQDIKTFDEMAVFDVEFELRKSSSTIRQDVEDNNGD